MHSTSVKLSSNVCKPECLFVCRSFGSTFGWHSHLCLSVVPVGVYSVLTFFVCVSSRNIAVEKLLFFTGRWSVLILRSYSSFWSLQCAICVYKIMTIIVCGLWIYLSNAQMNKHRQGCLFFIGNYQLFSEHKWALQYVSTQQLRRVWYVLRLLYCPQWGLLRETAHLPDQLHLEIDFYMWPWTFQISFSKPCQSRGNGTRENQFKLISEMRCFCLLL